MVYRNSGSGQFEAMDPTLFAGDDRYFGMQAVPADVNGDSVVDFVVPHRDEGPDDEWGSEDDFTTLVTLLNTTPAGSVRCGPARPRSPVVADESAHAGRGGSFHAGRQGAELWGPAWRQRRRLRYFHWQSSTREWVVVGFGPRAQSCRSRTSVPRRFG